MAPSNSSSDVTTNGNEYGSDTDAVVAAMTLLFASLTRDEIMEVMRRASPPDVAIFDAMDPEMAPRIHVLTSELAGVVRAVDGSSGFGALAAKNLRGSLLMASDAWFRIRTLMGVR